MYPAGSPGRGPPASGAFPRGQSPPIPDLTTIVPLPERGVRRLALLPRPDRRHQLGRFSFTRATTCTPTSPAVCRNRRGPTPHWRPRPRKAGTLLQSQASPRHCENRGTASSEAANSPPKGTLQKTPMGCLGLFRNPAAKGSKGAKGEARAGEKAPGRRPGRLGRGPFAYLGKTSAGSLELAR
jgi:hypothetical protein